MDVEELVQIGIDLHRESRYAHLGYDPEKLADSIRGLLRNQRGTHCLLLAVARDGNIAGFLLGYVAELFFSRDRVATNIVFYVRPEYRGSMAAAKLVLAFRAWARNRKVSELSLNITSGIEVEKFGAFLARMGFEHTGGNYSMWMD